MSLFTQKRAVETAKRSDSQRKSFSSLSSRRRSDASKSDPTIRVCRFERLENREYLDAQPIDVGVVYEEQGQEALGDKFYVAWVGGEAGETTLDSITISLDKNGNGKLDEGEGFFHTEEGGPYGVYSAKEFTLVEKTADVGYVYEVENGGTTLKISFTNFHAGDSFVFAIDVDEYQLQDGSGNETAVVEGAEFGGSLTKGIAGSKVSATFSSRRYQTETWAATFVDDYDDEYVRSAALSAAYDSSKLPFDLDDGNEGIWSAGVYDEFLLTPKPIVVSGFVYGDRDVDCNYDVGQDDPLANVEILLQAEDGTGRTWTTTTDANGYYEFNAADILPGNYLILSQTNVVGPKGESYFDFCAKGGEFGRKIDPLRVEIGGMQGGDVAPNNNFAKVLPGTISGFVFEDLNDANNKEPGENWDGIDYPAEIQLYRVDVDESGSETKTLVATQTVAADGSYRFILDGSVGLDGKRLLPEREYEIREIFSSGDYSDGNDYVGTLGGVVGNDVFENVYVGFGENGFNYNFGELKLGSIAGNVYEDRDDNGVRDPGEAGIAGVTIDLYQKIGGDYVKIATTTTDQNGEYLFENLDILNDYAVREVQPNDYDDGKDAAGSLGGVVSNDYISEIPVGWDDRGTNYDFGELKLGSIAGNVYEDRDDNGVRDPDEAGIGGVVVELYEWNGTDYVKVAETTTDADGEYLFEKLDINKEYAVKERQPNGYDDGKDAAGSLGGAVSDDYISEIPVGWDDRGTNYDFGELKLGSISGCVYHDKNDDGVKREDEPGIPGVVVKLFVFDETSGDYVETGRSATTDADGYYEFDSLDINRRYAVQEIHPEDWDDGKDAVGTLGGVVAKNDRIADVDVYWDAHGERYNFGELLPPGSLSGFVYEDDNDDGIKEEGEAGIKDVVVELFELGEDGAAKLVATTKTDENGYYLFANLESEKTYILRETQPTAYCDGKDSVGTIDGETVGKLGANDEIVGVYLKRRGVGIDYNFGELRPAELSGFVYEDDNDNGIKEEGEAGIAGVAATLYVLNEETGKYESTGRSVETDAEGRYVFDNLRPSRIYRIVETQPKEYVDGKDSAGSLGGDATTENDVIQAISVKPGDVGTGYDFGELRPAEISGYVYEDLNDNGIKDVGESGIPAVAVTLYALNEATGRYDATGRVASTDSAGRYVFDFLSPRQIYRVVETQPANYVDGKDTAGSLGGDAKAEKNAILAIVVKAGDVGTDYNFGELVPPPDDPNPPYIPDTHYTDRDYATPNLWGASPTYFSYRWDQPTIPGSSTNLYGGGGLPETFSWRLSVLNGGYPRSLDALTTTYGFRGELFNGDSAYRYVNVAWSPEDGFDYGEWIIRGADGNVLANYRFGAENAKPIVGDWSGDGYAKVGVFVSGRWFLDRNGDGVWDEEDLWAELGSQKDQPVSGDWDGDGKADIGIFGPQWSSDPLAISVEPGLPTDLNRNAASKVKRPKNAPPSETIFNRSELNVRAARRRDAAQVRLDLVDHVFQYGSDGDVALTGDWTGDGVSKIGVYRSGDWYFDMNGDGRWDDGDALIENMGGAGDQPVVGDFNGDGVDEIGLFADGVWRIDSDGDRRLDQTIRFGQAGDLAVVGDFNGDGVDELAVYRPSAGSGAEPETNRQANGSGEGAEASANEVAAL